MNQAIGELVCNRGRIAQLFLIIGATISTAVHRQEVDRTSAAVFGMNLVNTKLIKVADSVFLSFP